MASRSNTVVVRAHGKTLTTTTSMPVLEAVAPNAAHEPPHTYNRNDYLLEAPCDSAPLSPLQVPPGRPTRQCSFANNDESSSGPNTPPPIHTPSTLPAQLDGPHDYRPPMIPAALRTQFPSHTQAEPRPAAKPASNAPKNAIHDLLPFCTVGVPLNEAQVIALSDLGGSLKEIMLLALRARTDELVRVEMARAVGAKAAGEIIEFFSDEWELCPSG